MNELMLLVKEMIDEQLKLWIKADRFSWDDEDVLKKWIKSLTLNDIEKYIDLFRTCWFASRFIILFIRQIINTTRYIEKFSWK